MKSKKLLNALNEQVKHELDSAYTYLSMVAYFEEQNLPGMARWMMLQSQEEVEHAMKIFNFINDRGGRVVLDGLEKPPETFKSPLDAFEKALKHEEKISGLIHNLYKLALEEEDYPTQVMLQWFIDEQVEEEKNVGDAAAQVERAGDNPAALLTLDHQLGERQDEE